MDNRSGSDLTYCRECGGSKPVARILKPPRPRLRLLRPRPHVGGEHGRAAPARRRVHGARLARHTERLVALSVLVR